MSLKAQAPINFRIVKSPDHALLVQVDEGESFYSRLHYHPEYQITAIEHGIGLLFAGTTVTSFEPGDVFVLGPEMPHLFKETDEQSPLGVRAVSLFFDADSLGKQFFETKELQVLIEMLKTSTHGLRARRDEAMLLYFSVLETTKLTDEFLYIKFLEIMSIISRSNPILLNDAIDFSYDKNSDHDKLNEVVNFALENFDTDINIEQVAQMSFLSKSHFSATFKLKTGKTFITFLNSIRVENACLQLKNTDLTIEQVCYASGFRNVSNFTRQFKRIKNMTPSNYKNNWRIIPKID